MGKFKLVRMYLLGLREFKTRVFKSAQKIVSANLNTLKGDKFGPI